MQHVMWAGGEYITSACNGLDNVCKRKKCQGHASFHCFLGARTPWIIISHTELHMNVTRQQLKTSESTNNITGTSGWYIGFFSTAHLEAGVKGSSAVTVSQLSQKTYPNFPCIQVTKNTVSHPSKWNNVPRILFQNWSDNLRDRWHAIYLCHIMIFPIA